MIIEANSVLQDQTTPTGQYSTQFVEGEQTSNQMTFGALMVNMVIVSIHLS